MKAKLGPDQVKIEDRLTYFYLSTKEEHTLFTEQAAEHLLDVFGDSFLMRVDFSLFFCLED